MDVKYFKQSQQKNNVSEFDNYFTGSQALPTPTAQPLKLKRKMPIYMMVRKNY